MASSPELFVVCKNCNSQVSPYITECPYCGTRLRKRAPKIERSDREAAPKRRRKVPSGLGPLRSGEIPGIRGDELRRPAMTMALVAIGCLWWLALIPLRDEGYRLVLAPVGEWWQVLTAPFVHLSGWYQFAALGAVGVFGWLLERRQEDREGQSADEQVANVVVDEGRREVAPPFAVDGQDDRAEVQHRQVRGALDDQNQRRDRDRRDRRVGPVAGQRQS